MGLNKTIPPLSGRMGTLWTLATIKGSAVIEFGCMGHMAYGRTFLNRLGVFGGKLYSTHIRETDIAMGDVTRLKNAVHQVLEESDVSVIFLLPSTVPEIIGIDLKAVAKELSFEYPRVRFVTFATGGFNMSLTKGVEKTLLTLVKEFSQETGKSEKPTYNIIGSCADMFRFQGDSMEVERILKGAFDMGKNCAMVLNTNISELENVGRAHVNIVLRREGVAAAKYLEEKFGIPYIFARPYGLQGTIEWIHEIAKVLNVDANQEFVQHEMECAKESLDANNIVLQRFSFVHKDESRLMIAGHADVVLGIEKACKDEFKLLNTECYCDEKEMENEHISYLSDAVKDKLVTTNKCFFMGTGELIGKRKDGIGIQIANPDNVWRHPYEPPFLGFRGIVHLASLFVNEMIKLD